MTSIPSSVADKIVSIQEWKNSQISNLISGTSSIKFDESAAALSDDYGMSQVKQAFAVKKEQYTAQLSELGKFRSAIAEMSDKAKGISGLNQDSSNADIKSAVKSFISEYNSFQQKFAADFEKGGLLSDIDNAKISKFSMERDAGNVFNGSAKLGFGGLSNAGITQNKDGTLSIDEAAFDKALASNKEGVLAGVNDLGNNISKTATMLSSDDKFLDHSQKKYSDALVWIEQNNPANTSKPASGYNNNLLSLYSTVANNKG